MSDDNPVWDVNEDGQHPIFKLGKGAAQSDPRTLKFANYLRAGLPTPPVEWYFDTLHPEAPVEMFANNQYSCCVISGRAHQTHRYEILEQGRVIPISDAEVISEYLNQTGGKDEGLYTLQSLKLWRNRGWLVGGQMYFIQAFTSINWLDHDEVKRAIMANVGVGVGASLPVSAANQFQQSQTWDVVQGPSGREGSWGGHYMHVYGYNEIGPVVLTWGARQQLTWAFWDRYVDECYAIFDAGNNFDPEIITEPPVPPPVKPPEPDPVPTPSPTPTPTPTVPPRVHPPHKPSPPLNVTAKPNSFNEGDNIAQGVVKGWDSLQVAAYFATVRGTFVGNSTTGVMPVDYYRVGRTRYAASYASGRVASVTFTLRQY